MKNILIIIILLVTACANEQRYEAESSNLQIIEQEQELVDSLERMMNFIGYIDSAEIIEHVSHNFTELKETNEKLETTLIKTKKELVETKEQLVRTKVALFESEQVVKAICGDSIDTAANFELLPIENQ